MFYYYDLKEALKLKKGKTFLVEINDKITIITKARNKESALKKAYRYLQNNKIKLNKIRKYIFLF